MTKGITKSNGQKHSLDKFYTIPETAKFCCDKIDFSQYDLIVEPSAGNGSFSNLIPNCLAMDIEPEDSSIVKKDFFTFFPSLSYKNILTIGNPPFGQQSSLAIKFFNHAAEFSNTIAFIIPKSFRKASVQNKLNLYFTLVEDYDISEAFTLNGVPYNVPCCFQVWKKTSYKRDKIKVNWPEELKLCSKEFADFRVQRVGGNAGKAYIDKNGSIQSNYYFKNISKKKTEDIVNFINSCVFPQKNDTVGPRSISKYELAMELIPFLSTSENTDKSLINNKSKFNFGKIKIRS